MTKADIVDRVAEKSGFTKKDSIELVESVFELIKDTLVGGENLKVSGFGNFTVKTKADRRGRNPQTGEAITITARRILTFKPSLILKNSINSESSDAYMSAVRFEDDYQGIQEGTQRRRTVLGVC